MPEESVDMNETLIIHSEKDDVNEVVNYNGPTENKYLKLQNLNAVVRRFFDNTKVSEKSSNAEKNDRKNSSIKELTYVMCKKLKQNILRNPNSNRIKYDLVNENKQKDPLIEELEAFSLKDYRIRKENKRLLANKETKCCVRQKNSFQEELDEFDRKEYYSVENNEQLLANKGVAFFESFENKETLEGLKMNDTDLINMQAAVVTDESNITEDLSFLGHVNSDAMPKSVDKASVDSSSESMYKIKGHSLSNGKKEIIYEESKYLRRRISVEYDDQDSEKAKSEYRIKEFLKTNLVNFSSPQLLCGSAVIVNNDNTNVKFSTFKPDVKVVERAPIFERVSKTDQLSGGQVVLEEFADRYKYPNYYGEDSTIDDETSDTFYNYQPCFAKCTRQSKISTRYLTGGKVIDKSNAGISLPELYPSRKLDLKINFPSPSVKEHLSGGSLKESFDVEHDISLDFLSKTITFDDDISSTVNLSFNNDGNVLAMNFGCHNSGSEKFLNQVNSNYFNTNNRRYGYSSDASLASSSTSIPSNDLYDLKSSKSNINKQKKSIFKAGLSAITKKKSIKRSVSEYSFNSWKTNNGSSNPKHDGCIPSRSSASVAQDLNIPKFLSRYSVDPRNSFDPRNSVESLISCRINSILKTNSSPFM